MWENIYMSLAKFTHFTFFVMMLFTMGACFEEEETFNDFPVFGTWKAESSNSNRLDVLMIDSRGEICRAEITNASINPQLVFKGNISIDTVARLMRVEYTANTTGVDEFRYNITATDGGSPRITIMNLARKNSESFVMLNDKMDKPLCTPSAEDN